MSLIGVAHISSVENAASAAIDFRSGAAFRGSRSYQRAALAISAAATETVWMPKGECSMDQHIYKVIELVGSSETSIEDAIQSAVERASQTVKHIRWLEVVQTRGHVEDGRVRHYQVTVKLGFTLESGMTSPPSAD